MTWWSSASSIPPHCKFGRREGARWTTTTPRSSASGIISPWSGDGSQLLLYIDGELATTGGTPTGNYGSSGDNFKIGGGGIFDAAGNYFDGDHRRSCRLRQGTDFPADPFVNE